MSISIIMPNFLENSSICIKDRGEFSCQIVPVSNKSNFKIDQVYLIYSELTYINYWAYYNKLIDKFELCEIISKLGFNGIRDKQLIKKFISCDTNYKIYELSIKKFAIPHFYTIINDRVNWNKFCNDLEENSDYPIKKIIHIRELSDYIKSFL